MFFLAVLLLIVSEPLIKTKIQKRSKLEIIYSESAIDNKILLKK